MDKNNRWRHTGRYFHKLEFHIRLHTMVCSTFGYLTKPGKGDLIANTQTC